MDKKQKKPQFYMLIGLPGSGKSTWARAYAEKHKCVVHSSDAVRRERIAEVTVWHTMKVRTKASLEAGDSVIYDATNLSRKLRRDILDTVHEMGIERTAVLILTSIEECKRRNRSRKGRARVPNYVIDKMIRDFNIPTTHHEFDHIITVQSDIGDDTVDLNFDQENLHHAFTCEEHMRRAEALIHTQNEDLAEKDPKRLSILAEAARFHDVGKAFTKTFDTRPGKDPTIAHYYGHENYGAYWYLTTRKIDKRKLYIATIINYHMRPNYWGSERTRAADLRDFGPEMVDDLDRFHRADVGAKRPTE